MRHLTSARAFVLTAATLGVNLAVTQVTRAVFTDDIKIDNGYHAQETAFYCGPSSMQMMLDCPVVRANNLAAAQLTQDQLYNFSRPLNFLNIQGTDPIGFQRTMQAKDGTGSASGRAYQWWGFAPTALGGYYASRTVANTLKDFQVPVTVAVGHGAHWIDVNGVKATSNNPNVIGKTNNYAIQGFRTKDPWTGYWQTLNVNQRRALPAGLGRESYYRYGFDDRADGSKRPGLWFNFFNPVNPAPAPYGGQFVIEVDPASPEPPDDGNGGLSDGLPSDIPEGAEIDKPTALNDAISDLGNDADLNSLPGFENGNFDSAAADEMLVQSATDLANEGDFLIPYDGAGGADDITGAVMIDANTGVIDAATWLEPGDTPLSRDDLDQLFNDIASNNLPIDDVTPEPAMVGLILPAMMLLRRSRRA